MTAAVYFRMSCPVLCFKTYRLLNIRKCTLAPVGNLQHGLSHGGNSGVRVLRNTVMRSVPTCEGRSKWRLEKIAHWRLCDLYCAKYY
jgi:hypothetical protein